jgi:hypothetical protein
MGRKSRNCISDIEAKTHITANLAIPRFLKRIYPNN